MQAQVPVHPQGYHFPPPDAQPAYGYSNPQLLAPQQWPQHDEPQPYEINYQAYGADQGAFPHGGRGQHQGYDSDADFGDGYYEDEEPRRGKRWLLISVALVGAIGVGGALAYTYRSIVAPKSRVVATKTDTTAKTKVSVERPPFKVVEESPPKATEPPASEDPPSDQGARKVKTLVVTPHVPGITIYKPPEPPETAPVPSAKETVKVAPPSSRQAVVTVPPPDESKDEAKKDDEEETPVAPTPPPQSSKKQKTAMLHPTPAPRKEPPSGSGLGFVAVLKSDKSPMEATKSMADLQQKYPEVFEGKSFDVQEADLSARGMGTMFRVVVGPPGSRNWASGVCAQLKAAGYVGCWVKEY